MNRDSEPLEFYSLVRTRGPGTHVDAKQAAGVGGRCRAERGYIRVVYAVMIGEITYSFDHDELVSLGIVLDRYALYPAAE